MASTLLSRRVGWILACSLVAAAIAAITIEVRSTGARSHAQPHVQVGPTDPYLSPRSDHDPDLIAGERRQVSSSRSESVVDTGHIRGVVVVPSGIPLESVTIHASGGGPEGVDLDAITDAEGRFTLGPLRKGVGLTVSHVQYVELDRTPRVQNQDGAWQDMAITMVRASAVTVQVESQPGDPLAGVEVKLRLADSDPLSAPLDGVGLTFVRSRLPRAGVSDSSGLVKFPRVWTGRSLSFEFLWRGCTYYAEERSENLLLLVESEARDSLKSAIILTPPGVHSLLVRLPSVCMVRGVVRYADGGAPVPNPWIKVRERHDDGWKLKGFSLQVRGSQAGEFEFAVPRDGTAIGLVASDGKRFNRGGYGGESPVENAAVLAMTSDELDTDLVEVVVVVRPLLSISGRVRESDGSAPPPLTIVRAVPSGAASYRSATTLGFRAASSCKGGGRFRIDGLEAGRYDLVVDEQIDMSAVPRALAVTFPGAEHVFPYVAAGTTDLELEIPDSGKAHVSLRVLASEGLESMRIVIQREYGASVPMPPPRTPEDLHIASLTNWPRLAPASHTGLVIRSEPTGVSREILYYRVEGAETHELPPLGRGSYSIGVAAFATDGTPYFPMASGPVYLEPGNYRFTFSLQVTGTLKGRVSLHENDGPLYAGLVDEHNRLLPLFGQDTGRPLFRQRLSPDGNFFFYMVPVGNLRFVLGTDRGVTNGEFLYTQEVEGVAGSTTPIEIFR